MRRLASLLFPIARLAVALLLPALAFAQGAPPRPAPAITAPAGIGKPHTCGRAYYPPDAVRLNQQGTTMIGFTVKADGTIRDIHVEKTSGYDSLDQASMACAQGWTYRPAVQNGQPVDVPWRANIAWKLMESIEPASERTFGTYRCPEHHSDPANKTTPLPALVILRVDADGNVQQAAVTLSSGDAVFDAYVTQCAKQWRYNPATQSGTPVPDVVRAIVAWGGATPPRDVIPVLASADDDCTRYPLPAPPAPVQALFAVETDGSVSNVHLSGTSGDTGYDSYIASCIAKWKYHPAINIGRAQRVDWGTTVTWKSAP